MRETSTCQLISGCRQGSISYTASTSFHPPPNLFPAPWLPSFDSLGKLIAALGGDDRLVLQPMITTSYGQRVQHASRALKSRLNGLQSEHGYGGHAPKPCHRSVTDWCLAHIPQSCILTASNAAILALGDVPKSLRAGKHMARTFMSRALTHRRHWGSSIA